MQSYAQPRFTEDEGLALWREISDDINDRNLTALSLVRVLFKFCIFSVLLSIATYLVWTTNSILLQSTLYIFIALLLAQFPLHRQLIFREGWQTDLKHFFVSHAGVQLLSFAALIPA